MRNKIKKSTWITTLILCFLAYPLCASAGASDSPESAHEALVNKVVYLVEAGDPALLEKQVATTLIEASKKFNPDISADDWTSVQSDVDDVITKKIRPGFGEQALLTRFFIKTANFSDPDLEHLVTLLQDPVMKKWAQAMRTSMSAPYIATMAQNSNNQVCFVVSLVLRRHGLKTSYTPPNRN